MLLVGESGDFTSTEHVLRRSCLSLAEFVWSEMLCVPAQFLGLTWSRLPAPTGKFCVCMLFRRAVMDRDLKFGGEPSPSLIKEDANEDAPNTLSDIILPTYTHSFHGYAGAR